MIFQILIDECDSVTFVSNDLVQKMEIFKGVKHLKSLVTYAGAEPIVSKNISEEEIETFRKLYNIKDNAIVLLGLGLTANKLKAEGAKILIKSMMKLKVLYPNIILLLTRNAKYSSELKDFAKSQNISDYVIFTGDVENQLVPLKICDIYTHIPMGEGGVSLALLEAMSMGKPIVATSVGGIPEAIEDGINGLLIDPIEDSLIQKIDFLLKNRDFAAKMGYNAKRTSYEKFTWEKTTEEFIKIYS
jgi:glycosyltransferase involved in cell wall biosynthesis